MRKKFGFDYIILGSGPAGSTAALNLAGSKKRIGVVEENFFGGSDLAGRDLPYLVALDFAQSFHKVANSPELTGQDLSFNFPTIANRKARISSAMSQITKKELESKGIACIKGHANFLDAHTIAVGKQQFTSANFILATGSRPKTKQIFGLDQVNYLTPDTIFTLRRLPKAVLVIGGGSTGCETAEYFAKLGAKVLLMEQKDRLLPREDVDVSETMTNYFSKNLHVMVLPNYKVVALEKAKNETKVVFSNNRREKSIHIECVVLATGSTPALDYGLENAGVSYNEKGIIVNKLFSTSAKNIFAIGDCVGGESSTSRATYEGFILANNLKNKSKNLINYQGFTRLTGTSPAIATVGLNELELKAKKRKYKKAVTPLSIIPLSKIDNIPGFVKLLSDSSNHILGATVVSPHAAYLIQEIALAIRHNLSAIEIASTPHPVNSFSYAVRIAAKKLIETKKASA